MWQNDFKMLSKLNYYYPGGGWVGGWGRKKPDIMQDSVQLNLPTGTGTKLGKNMTKVARTNNACTNVTPK